MNTILTEKKSDRDILRGLLIISVVIGHCSPNWISQVIYWFHMPAFFILSGELHKSVYSKEYLKRKAVNFLWPLFAYSFAIEVIWQNKILNFLKIIILGGGRYVTGVYWFLPVLFFTEILYSLLLKLKLDDKKLWLISMLLLAASSVYSYAFYRGLPNNYLEWPDIKKVPWNLDVVAFALSYYIFGHLGKKNKRVLLDKAKIIESLLSIFFIVAIICKIVTTFEYRIDVKLAIYPNFLFNLFLPVGGYCIMNQMAHLITKWQIIGRVLSDIGKNSLSIMFSHLPLISFISSHITVAWWFKVILGVFIPYILVGNLKKLISKRNHYLRTERWDGIFRLLMRL